MKTKLYRRKIAVENSAVGNLVSIMGNHKIWNEILIATSGKSGSFYPSPAEQKASIRRESFSFFIQRFSRQSPIRRRSNSSLRKPLRFAEAFLGFFMKEKFSPEWRKRNILFPLIKSPFYSLCLNMEQYVASNPLP